MPVGTPNSRKGIHGVATAFEFVEEPAGSSVGEIVDVYGAASLGGGRTMDYWNTETEMERG